MQTVIPPLAGRLSPGWMFEKSLEILREEKVGKKARRGKPFKIISRGSALVKIYGRKSGPFTIAWRESSCGRRRRAMRSALSKAISLAEEKATALANGETWRLQMTQRDWASYQRSLELLQVGTTSTSSVMPPLEVAIAEYVRIQNRLRSLGRTFDELDSFFQERQRAGIRSKNIPELVRDLLASREAIGGRGRPAGEAWRIKLKQQLDRFATRFAGPLESVSGPDIESWLNNLTGRNNRGKDSPVRVGPHTRANYRAAILSLVRFAKFKRYLPETWSELDEVHAAKPQDAEIKILTPEQITKLLSRAPASLVPFIALTAFAGIRHQEMVSTTKKVLLDWRDIDLDAGAIYIRKAVAKTGRDRLVPISANLSAWLSRYRQPNGPVCELLNTGAALKRAKMKAGIPAGKNETRNTLRKSFISYRLAIVKNAGQVAEEAGTSIAKIRSNYKRPAPESEAKRWFDIWPTSADIVQLPLKLG